MRLISRNSQQRFKKISKLNFIKKMIYFPIASKRCWMIRLRNCNLPQF